MSDDDLWRPKEHATRDRSPENDSPADDGPESSSQQPVTDETQPLYGTPPPSAGGTSYDPPPGPAAVPPPENPFGAPQQNPYGSPGQGYGQPGRSFQPPPNPYQSPHEYSPPQNPYGAPYRPAYAGGVLPDHSSATTAMVLGIISLVGVALCGGLTLILAPAAWIVGAKSVREIDASAGRYGGRDRAQAGKIMGIIGTVLLALGILAIIAVVVLVIALGDGSDPGPVFPSPNARIG
jgi:hypothetical protein